MAALAQGMVSNIINSTSPTGASGAPGTWTAMGGSAMKVQLTSDAPTASSEGTQLTAGTGYTTGGQAVPAASSASSNGSSVTLPATSAMSWTNGGTTWSIVGFNLVDNAATTRSWFGTFTGQPISVANGNTFQIAIGGITLSLT